MRKCLNEYLLRLRILNSDFGRESGWEIEHQGQCIATLTEPWMEDMFWDSYRMNVLSDDLAIRKKVLTNEFWNSAEADAIVLRSREFRTIAQFAVPAKNPITTDGRIVMRGLYIPVTKDRLLERVGLWVMRVFYKISRTNKLD
jgi:hypothetical protein